jgi:hypothetical protein
MKAYELLDNEDKWIQGNFATDINGFSVSPTDDNACCWCVVGALMKCYGEGWREKVDLLYNNKLIPSVRSITNWNDSSYYHVIYEALKKLDL